MAKAKKTETIRICPYDLPVCPVDPDDPRLSEGAHGSDGTFVPAPCPHIIVRNDVTGLFSGSIRLHEAIEAIGELHGLGLREYQVVGLEVGLLRFIRDNPQLIKDLQA